MSDERSLQTSREAIRSALSEIAPEADLDKVPPDANLREELDLDSMDFLRFVTGLHERLGVDIPESDYARIATLRTCMEYLDARAGRRT